MQARCPQRGQTCGRRSSFRLPKPATTINQPTISVGRIVAMVWELMPQSCREAGPGPSAPTRISRAADYRPLHTIGTWTRRP